jgi:hypothetical protein
MRIIIVVIDIVAIYFNFIGDCVSNSHYWGMKSFRVITEGKSVPQHSLKWHPVLSDMQTAPWAPMTVRTRSHT